MQTSNVSTVNNAVKLRARIKQEFWKVLPLIQINTEKSLEEARRKLGFLYQLIERFMVIEKKSLLKSDKIALEYLQSQILHFLKEFEEISPTERLKTAKSLQRTAESTLETD